MGLRGGLRGRRRAPPEPAVVESPCRTRSPATRGANDIEAVGDRGGEIRWVRGPTTPDTEEHTPVEPFVARKLAPGAARGQGSRRPTGNVVCERYARPPRCARAIILRLLRVVAAVLLPLALAVGCASEPSVTYVSLGDSLAVGVGASDPQERGYVPLYREFLERETGREVRLVQLGLSGETSESFVNGPDSQLVRAEAALRESPGGTVTLSIGGNDLLRTSDGTEAEREAALVRYAENLNLILRTLKDASELPSSITVLALYNPAPGSFTDEWAERMNDTIRDVAARNGVRVAAADRVFRGQEAEYAHHARYPWDIHPTDRGHEALARALAEATSRD